MEEKENTLAQMQAEFDRMRAEYEAQIAALRDATPAVSQAEEEQALARRLAFVKREEEYLNEYVEIRLFKDNGKYKDDVYVAINGKNCLIRRGVWTRIRRKFALLLDQSEIQDLRTAELVAREADRFADENRRHG